MDVETVLLVEQRGWQTDSIVVTGRDRGAARQQWTRACSWWKIHLERHGLSTSSFSDFSPSPHGPQFSLWRPLCIPSGATHLSIYLFLDSMEADLWEVISHILSRPLTYRASKDSYLEEPPYPFSYKLATSPGLVMLDGFEKKIYRFWS